MYCKNCGNYNSDKASFCKKCGDKITTSESETKQEFHSNNESKRYHRIRESSYFSRLFKGRLNRRNYLVGIILLYALIFGLAFLVGISYGFVTGDEDITSIEWLYYLVVYTISILYGLSLNIRRFHDIGKSGWYLLLGLIPFVNIGIAIWLFLGAGENKSNKYGNPPLPEIDINDSLGF